MGPQQQLNGTPPTGIRRCPGDNCDVLDREYRIQAPPTVNKSLRTGGLMGVGESGIYVCSLK